MVPPELTLKYASAHLIVPESSSDQPSLVSHESGGHRGNLPNSQSGNDELSGLQLKDDVSPRSKDVDPTQGATDCDESRYELVASPVGHHPYAGPLLNAARAVLALYDDHIGIADEDALPVFEARRIVYGPTDGLVAVRIVEESRELSQPYGRVGNVDGEVASSNGRLSRDETELGTGLRLLGRLLLDGQALPLGIRTVEEDATTVQCSSDPEPGECVVTSQPVVVPRELHPNTSVVAQQPVGVPRDVHPEIVALSVSKFAFRWDHCKRQIETYLRQGLPIHGEGRGRRIVIAEGDEWMRLYRDPLARRASQAAQRHATSMNRGPSDAGS